MEQMVYDSLKSAILNRKLPPGNQLVENTIAQKLNVSRTPIRNAIKKLEVEGLVTLIPNRGAFVIQPTIEEIIEAFEMRRELEKLGVRYGLKEVSPEDIHHLRTLNGRVKEAFEEQDINRYLDENKQFHLFLAKKGNNRYVSQFLEMIFNQINVYLLLYDAFNYSNIKGEDIYNEHEKIISFIAEKNEEKLMIYMDSQLNRILQEIKLDKMNYQALENIF